MTPPHLWLLVGGNGAGKSTFYRMSSLRDLPFINADRIARRISPDAPQLAEYEAALKAEALRQRYLTLGESFCAETVFSHSSKVDYVRAARFCSGFPGLPTRPPRTRLAVWLGHPASPARLSEPVLSPEPSVQGDNRVCPELFARGPDVLCQGARERRGRGRKAGATARASGASR